MVVAVVALVLSVGVVPASAHRFSKHQAARVAVRASRKAYAFMHVHWYAHYHCHWTHDGRVKCVVHLYTATQLVPSPFTGPGMAAEATSSWSATAKVTVWYSRKHHRLRASTW